MEILILVKRFILPYTVLMRVEEKVAKTLINSKKTLALGESCTGGLVANRLTNVPGSSNFLHFSVVAYCNDAKFKLLKVPKTLISRYGAVSAQTALAMAKGARTKLKSDFGIGITGIAGPTGGTKQKPVGLTFIAVSTPVESICIECKFTGSRVNIKQKASSQALRLLEEFLI